MDHELVLEIPVHLQISYLFEGCKFFEYQTDKNLLNGPGT